MLNRGRWGTTWDTQLTRAIHRLNPPFGDRSHEKMAHGKETTQMHEGSEPLMQTLF
jgi:hypothetical protein